MSVDALLARLDAVRKTGDGRWISRCPSHDDRRPSLAIRELDDGRILLHCFAECPASDVLAAVNLNFEDLFPDRVHHGQSKPVRRPFYPADILRCVGFEALIAGVAAGNLAQGIDLTPVDRDRLFLAVGRLRAAAEMSHA